MRSKLDGVTMARSKTLIKVYNIWIDGITYSFLSFHFFSEIVTFSLAQSSALAGLLFSGRIDDPPETDPLRMRTFLDYSMGRPPAAYLAHAAPGWRHQGGTSPVGKDRS